MIKRVQDAEALVFRCNICNAINETAISLLERETPSCRVCKSTVRARSIIMALTIELFGRSLAISQIQPRRFEISGYGLSCWDGYARRLSSRMNFTNTFLHKEPHLDITNLRDEEPGKLDFLIASEVFEHVVPPVEKAFENARKLLKDDGVFIITVPFTNPGEEFIPTDEHYPDLFDYEIKGNGNSATLENTTRYGLKQVHANLKFHGGPGNTLEMRVFSESSLITALFNAGFEKISVFGGSDLMHGISWKNGCSVPLAARVKSGPARFVRPPKPLTGDTLVHKCSNLARIVASELHRLSLRRH